MNWPKLYKIELVYAIAFPMNVDPNSDFLSWAKISQQAIKTKSTCIGYLEQFLALLQSYFNNSHKLPKPNEQYTKQFEDDVIPNVISNDIMKNDGNDIFVSNLTTFLKEISILFYEDIIKYNFQHIDTFLLIFIFSNKLYTHGMTPFSKGFTFSDVCSNFLKKNPFQQLLRAIQNKPCFPLFHVTYALFNDFKDFVNPNEIEKFFQQTTNQFIFLLQSMNSENLNEIKPKIIKACLKYIFEYTSKRQNYENLWEKCADFLLFSLKNGNQEHQTAAAKSIYQMVIFSDIYRMQVLERIKKMNLVNLLINNDFEEKLIGYFTSIISQFLSICMPTKNEILHLYDIITENENSKLKPLFLFFIKNLSTENSVDLFSTIFETRPTTKKHVEILSLCISELMILNSMVGNKIINHFMYLIDKDETAEVSILFFQKILPLSLPKEIVSMIVDISNRKLIEPTLKESSIYFTKVIITIPNRLTVKYTFSLFNSIIKSIELHEDNAELLFDMIVSALTIYQKSVLSTEQLKKLLPIINKNQWWEKFSTIFMKRSSLFFTLNGLIEFENEINKFDFEKASPQFTLFLISFISHLCVYKKIYNSSRGNYISVQDIPDLQYIIRIILKTPNHQSFVYVMNYYILIWNHLEKITSRDATLHFLQCFMPYISDNSGDEKKVSGEVKNRIFQLMIKLIEVLEKSVSIEDFGIKRHQQSNVPDVNVTVSVRNSKTLTISIKENQTLDDILKKTAFFMGLTSDSLKFKKICDPYISIKQTSLRKFKVEIVREKRKEIKLKDIPTQIYVDNGIDEILLSYLKHENSLDAWQLLVKMPTNKNLMNKLSDPNEIKNIFVTSDSVSHLYFQYEIESLLEAIKINKSYSSYENCGTLILKELINGRIEGNEITPALEIIYLSNPDLNDIEIKDAIIFLLSKGQNGFTPLFERLVKKYTNQICNFLMVEKSINKELIYSAPVEYTSILCFFAENYDREIVFNFLIELVTDLSKFKDSIEPILLLYDKIVSNQEEALLLVNKINSIVEQLKPNQFPGLCNSLLKIFNRFPGIENDISKLIPYIINQLYSTDDINSLLNFLLKLKSQSSSEICKILQVHCDFYNYSTTENQRRYFTALKFNSNMNLSFLSTILQQLFFNQSFKSKVISEKVDIDFYNSLRKLFCILQFSNLPFYPISEIYSTMKLGNMSNPSRFYDYIMTSLPSQFSEPFTGTLLDIQQDLTAQVISTKQAKFMKLELNAIERYSVADCLEHFFQEEKVRFKEAVHHFTIGEFPNVLVLLLKIFVYDQFEDLLSKIGTTMIVSDTLQLSIKSNVTNSPVYNLSGAIYHKGRIYGGRYISQIIHNGNSYLFDNDIVCNFERTEDMSPYLLFYVRQGTEEPITDIEIPEDVNELIHNVNENYQRNQILFSDSFRTFVMNFNDALLITRYLINVFCHSKFDPNLINDFLDKELVNVSEALEFLHENINIINELKDKQMKKMILYLAKVLINKASKEDEKESIKDFFSICITNLETKSLHELMIYYLTQVNYNNKSEITFDWGEKIASIITKDHDNSYLLFPILSTLKYSEYQIFFTGKVSSLIYSDYNSLNSFIKYLISIDVNSMNIIKLTPEKYYSNLLISAFISNFIDINFELLNSETIEKKFLLQSLVNGLDNRIEGLRISIIDHFSFLLEFLPIPEGKFAEAVIYGLFPNLVNPIDGDKKRLKFNDFTSESTEASVNEEGTNENENENDDDDDDDDTNHIEEEEEEEWNEEEDDELNQNKSEILKIEKIEDENEKKLMEKIFQLTVDFIAKLDDDKLLYYILRVIDWMVDVADFMNNDLVKVCLQIMLKKIDKKRTVKNEERSLVLKIMKVFPQKFFTKYFSSMIKFSLPTTHPSIFAHFFYATSTFLKKNSNENIVQDFIKSHNFFYSLRYFLKKSNIIDLEMFIENTKKIKSINLAEIIENGLIRHLTIQKVICYQSFAQEIDKKIANRFIRFYFKKCADFKDKYIPLFNRFIDSISKIMKLEISRSSLYIKNVNSVFSLFEKDKSKSFRNELQNNIIIMSQSDNLVQSKFVDLIINSNSKRSNQLRIDLYSTFFCICEDPKLINHGLEMLANFIDNCKQKEVINILNSINSMLSKRSKKSSQKVDSGHIADGIETEKICDILIILYNYLEWSNETACSFEFVLKLLPSSSIFSLIDALLDVMEERDDESSEIDRNDNKPFGNKITETVLTDVIKKGISFLKARPELKSDILALFKEGGFLENWPPKLQEYRSFYFDT